MLTKEKLTLALARSKDKADALQNIGALLLWQYGNHGQEGDEEAPHGFDVLLAVFQHGKKEAKSGKRKGGGPPEAHFVEQTWVDANYINVKGEQGLKNIHQAMDEDLVRFKYDMDGVYVLFPGSSSTAAGDAIAASGWDFIS